MINILINTLKSTMDNKNYYPVILYKLYNEISKQYTKYYNDEYIAKSIIFQYIDWIERYIFLYHKHKHHKLKYHYKNQIDFNIKQLLNYLNKVKDGKHK